MNNQTKSNTVSLRHVTQELLACYGKVNKHQQQFFINEVPPDIFIPRSTNWLAPLMGDLLEIISDQKQNGFVYISAAVYQNKAQLIIKQ